VWSYRLERRAGRTTTRTFHRLPPPLPHYSYTVTCYSHYTTTWWHAPTPPGLHAVMGGHLLKGYTGSHPSFLHRHSPPPRTCLPPACCRREPACAPHILPPSFLPPPGDSPPFLLPAVTQTHSAAAAADSFCLPPACYRSPAAAPPVYLPTPAAIPHIPFCTCAVLPRTCRFPAVIACRLDFTTAYYLP